MQVSPAATVINTTLKQTTVTKSQEQILIQSSGAMIAVIVIGIIIILAILLIILKTYNRRTHASRMLRRSKPRPKVSLSTSQSNVPLNTVGVTSVSGSIPLASLATENSFRMPRAELSSLEEQHMEQASTNSGSTAVTIHDHPSLENT